MRMKWIKAIAAAVILICLFSIVNNMECRQAQRAAKWQNSVQAIELEQEKMQADIIKIREQLLAAEQELRVQNALIWDTRERVHLDLEVELEGEH